MPIIWLFAWAIIVASAVTIAFKFYLPKIRARYTDREQVLSSYSDQKQMIYYLICITLSIGMSAICGYVSAVRQDPWIGALKMFFALIVLNVIALIDFELCIVPNGCIALLLIGRCICFIPELVVGDGSFLIRLINCVVAGTVCLLFLLTVSKITRGGIGYGDVKLFGALGFLCGFSAVLYTLFFSFFLCAVFSVMLLAFKKKRIKDGLPMGPFIWLGFATAIILGLC